VRILGRELLRKSLLILVAIFSTSLFSGAAHAQGILQIFLGYSYLRPTVSDDVSTTCAPGPTCPGAVSETVHPSVNGWDGSATLSPKKHFGITADAAGNYGSLQGSTLHFQSYLFGPQIRFGKSISPFGHFLLGRARETVSYNGLAFYMYNRSFAWEGGGGVDVKIGPYLSVRAIQLDYLGTSFSELGNTTQHQLRASAGIVIHF
jgi:hypothetical protein